MLNNGDKFGKYRIVKRIGVDEEGNSKGANASVYVAVYKNKEYVLKIPNYAERLENHFREISNWAKVSLHPNILTYYETVSFEGNIGFVSEYIQTGSLNDWLESVAHRSATQKMLMINGILDGLEHLHKNGILHRDLKPENIFVKNDIPLLADFGSAKDFDFAESQQAYGFTEKYAPPELVELRDEFGPVAKYQITKFDDLWSVSIIICEIFTNQYPFERISALIDAKLRPFPPNTDEMTVHFLQKALRKERLHRFQTIAEMKAALKVLENEIIRLKTLEDEEFQKQQAESQRLKAEAEQAEKERIRVIEIERQKLIELKRIEREEAERQRIIELKRIERQEAERQRIIELKRIERQEAERQKLIELKRIEDEAAANRLKKLAEEQKQAETEKFSFTALPPTKDWREIEREKEVEAKRRQADIDQLERDLFETPKRKLPIILAGGIGLVILIGIILGGGVFYNSLSNNSAKVGNTNTNINKPINISINANLSISNVNVNANTANIKVTPTITPTPKVEIKATPLSTATPKATATSTPEIVKPTPKVEELPIVVATPRQSPKPTRKAKPQSAPKSDDCILTRSC